MISLCYFIFPVCLSLSLFFKDLPVFVIVIVVSATFVFFVVIVVTTTSFVTATSFVAFVIFKLFELRDRVQDQDHVKIQRSLILHRSWSIKRVSVFDGENSHPDLDSIIYLNAPLPDVIFLKARGVFPPIVIYIDSADSPDYELSPSELNLFGLIFDYDRESKTFLLSSKYYTTNEVFKIYKAVFDTLKKFNERGYFSGTSLLNSFTDEISIHLVKFGYKNKRLGSSDNSYTLWFNVIFINLFFIIVVIFLLLLIN